MTIGSAVGSDVKKILIITSSGGGGLLQTATAKAQEASAKYPDLQIVRKDLLKDWILQPIGHWFIKLWNGAQKSGSVSILVAWVYLQFLADIFLHPNVFLCALYTLFKEDVDHIIDTQPLGTSAIIKAVRIYNWRRKKKVRIEKVLVDLPTKKATHFFRSIKKLSKENRKFLQLTAIAPLLEEGETAEQFWQSTCGFSEKEVQLEDVYVRKAFRAYQGKSKVKEQMDLKMRFRSRQEQKTMHQAFSRGSIGAFLEEESYCFSIRPQDKVVTVLLGSQPSIKGTLGYVRNIVSFGRCYPSIRTHLFVFCGEFLEGKRTLFHEVVETVNEIHPYPSQVSVIPFCFQDESIIAPLFHRSDITCTRSGGQTAMELMCVSTGEIWIHSEAQPGDNLLKGIPGWEAASALYLQKLKGAKILTPESIATYAVPVYREEEKA